MARSAGPRLALLLIPAVAMLSGCGGAVSQPVATVGNTQITRSDVGHWMATLAGGDYYEVSHRHRAPEGLVSEPADYGRCATAIKDAASQGHKPPPAEGELRQKCQQLYERLHEQAVAYLVENQWFVGIAHQLGMNATAGQTQQILEKVKHEYVNARRFKQYLADNHRSLADERYIAELDVIKGQLSQKLVSTDPQTQATVNKLTRAWTERTSCRPGYVVPHCRQYNQNRPAPSGPPASVLFEQVATLIGATPCVNKPACGSVR